MFQEEVSCGRQKRICSQHQPINSPIRWVGGKSRLRKQIIPLLPPHTCYVEPFAGGAWVLFGKPSSPVEVLNDVDQELINFFRVVKNCPEKLIQSFEWELVARAEFQRLAGLDPAELDEVQRAHRFYYLIMAGWGGELDYPRFQTSITDGGGGNRLIGALKTLQERLKPVHDRLRSVIIECLDWQQCLDRYDRRKYARPQSRSVDCQLQPARTETLHGRREIAGHSHSGCGVAGKPLKHSTIPRPKDV